jgi:hypothetical protein
MPPSANQLPDPDLVLAPELASPEPLAPRPLAIYPTREALLEAIQSWSKYACDRWLSAESRSQGIRSTPSRGTACPFSILGVEAPSGLGWEIRYRPEAIYNSLNHS